MRCPHCGANEDRVIARRDVEGFTAYRRRRECGACGRRFNTTERIVVPRDLEFDRWLAAETGNRDQTKELDDGANEKPDRGRHEGDGGARG